MKEVSKKLGSKQQFELKDYEQFERKAEKQGKNKLNRESESYLDYGLDEEEDLKKYERYLK
jgi:hypothetical protein